MDPIDSHIYSFDMVGETGLIHDVALETSPPNLETTSSPISEIPSEEPPTSSRRSTVLSNISAPSAWRIRRAGNMLALKPHERPASETSRNHSADSVLTKASSKVEGASRRALSSVIGSIKRRFGRGKKEVDSTSNGRDFDSDQISEKVPKEVDFSGQYPALQAKSDTRPPLLQALSEPLQAISGAHRRWNFHGRRPLSKNLVQRPNSEQYAYRPSIATSRDFGLAYPCLPKILADGVTMIKVSGKGEKQRKFRVDKEQELVLWESKKSGIISIRKIQQIRMRKAAEYWRQHFGFGPEYEDRWITITYLGDTRYKTLHVVAPDSEIALALYRFLVEAVELRDAVLALFSHHLIPPKIKFDANHASHLALMDLHLTYEEYQLIWERYYWKSPEFSNGRIIDFAGIERMATRLGLGLSSIALREKFEIVDTSGSGQLNFQQFQDFWRYRRRRCEIRTLLRDLQMGNEAHELTFEEFQRFLVDYQKDTRPLTELRTLFFSYATPPATSECSQSAPEGESRDRIPPLVLSLEAFTAYLMSFDNAPFDQHNSTTYQDMTRPLPEYYISSSHNTYLVGNQVVGDSTIEGYVIALLNSCRSVEIDIFDGDKEPIITHGGTLTSKVPLRDICEAIAKHAFVTSPYPIIISAEIHCGLSQQDKIAEIMRQCFGESLVDKRLDGDLVQLEQLPSPEALKGRILLKAKNLHAMEAIATDSVISLVDSAVDIDSRGDVGVVPTSRSRSLERRGSFGFNNQRRGSRSNSVQPLTLYPSSESVSPPKDGPIDSNWVEIGLASTLRPPTPSQGSIKGRGISANLAALLVYTVGVKFRGLGKKAHYAVEHMFSLSENKVDKMLKDGTTGHPKTNDTLEVTSNSASLGGMLDLIKHSQTHLVRTYPKGTRLRSSNYLPHRYWAAGAQLVALNWQTADLGSIINRAMFLRNGQSGYVLKPAPLLAKEYNEDSILRRSRYRFNVKIISGQQIPRRRDREQHGRSSIDKNTVDPYVQMFVHIPDWPDKGKVASTPNDWAAGPEREPVYGPEASPGKSLRHLSLERQRSNKATSKNVPASNNTVQARTGAVKNNGFDPKWQETLSVEFEVANDMLDLVFVQLVVKDETVNDDEHSLAMYCIPLACLKPGYRHIPLHDQQMTPYLFATLFVHVDLHKLS